MNLAAPYWSVFPCAGRLGNRLFQLAAVYAHCRRNNCACTVPWGYDPLMQAVGRFLRYPFPRWDFTPKKVIEWYSMTYSPFPDDLWSGAIDGVFASSKYWKPDCEADIMHMYRRFVHPDKREDAAAIHIRLGDYLDPGLKGKYWVTTDDYLAEAVARLSPQVRELMLFSDSPFAAYDQLARVVPAGRFDDIRVDMASQSPDDSIRTLQEMTRYGEFVMSASTFSWWGAFLGKPRQVIVPKTWFNHTITDWEDVYEPEWIRL